MHSRKTLGQYLREHREQKNMSLDEVARETNIAKKYIEALENDEYSFFPAEMYVTGFLSAYIEFLEIDKDLVLSMYQRVITKEQEVPLEELYALHRTDGKLKKIVTIIALILPIFILVLIFVLSSSNKTNIKTSKNDTIDSNPKSMVLDINVEDLPTNNEFTVGVNDEIRILNNNSVTILMFLGHGKAKNQIVFRLGSNQYTQKSGDILNADLTGDGNNDLGIEFINVSDQQVSFSLTVKKQNMQNSLSGNLQSSNFSLAPYINAIQNEAAIGPVNGVAKFTVKITADRPAWLEYKTDSASPVQTLLNTGQTTSFTFTDGLALLLGNAGAVTISFGELTNVVKGGAPGESSYSVFYKKFDQGSYQLFRAQLK